MRWGDLTASLCPALRPPLPSPSNPGEHRGPRSAHEEPHGHSGQPHTLPISTEAATHVLSPPHRPQEPTGPPAHLHEGPELDSERLPTDSPGHVSREPYRLLGPSTDAPGSASRGLHGLAWSGSADTPGRTDTPACPAPPRPVPPCPASPHQAAVSHDQHHVDPREPVAAGPRHARPGAGPHNMAATEPPCAHTT